MATTKKAAAKAKEPMVSKNFSNRFKVVCMECGKKFQTVKEIPYCPKCNSADISLADEVTEPKAKEVKSTAEVTKKKVIRKPLDKAKAKKVVEISNAINEILAEMPDGIHGSTNDRRKKQVAEELAVRDGVVKPANLDIDAACARIAAANASAHTPA